MNFTLHLTEHCNMECSYCTREKRVKRMSREVLFASCDLAFSKGKTAGLCFFGGEPLLEKELIFEALNYCEQKSMQTGKPFASKMTTNGTLLDPEFLKRVKRAGMEIGISFDGIAQDICRRFADGGATKSCIEEKAKLLLRELPMSYAMMTIAPEAVDQYAASVRYLYALGFHKVSATIAYGRRVQWTDEHMERLQCQMEQIAKFYEQLFLAGERFFFGPFDGKISECIRGYNPSERCHLGYRQMPITPEGKIYPCTQFIGDEDFYLGDVFTGLLVEKQSELAKRYAMPKECENCDLKKRCTNSCGCLNRMETGDENRVSPLQCTYERMLITLCDTLAERLFAENPKLFAKRFG